MKGKKEEFIVFRVFLVISIHLAVDLRWPLTGRGNGVGGRRMSKF